MANLKERHVHIKFCIKLGEDATETSRILEVATGEQAVGRTQVFEWFPDFKSCATST